LSTNDTFPEGDGPLIRLASRSSADYRQKEPMASGDQARHPIATTRALIKRSGVQVHVQKDDIAIGNDEPIIKEREDAATDQQGM